MRILGDKLVNRRVRVVISSPSSSNYHEVVRDDLEITEHRVVFKLNFKDSKEPNTGEIKIYNLAENARSLIQKKGSKVTLEAGYKDSGTARIFVGDVRIGDNGYDGKAAEWISTLKLGDGVRAYQNARVNKSFGPKTTAGDVLQYLGEASGLQLGNVPKKILDLTVTYDNGYSVSGKWSDAMNQFCNSVGYKWSIQNQTLQVLLPGQAASEGLIPEISAESGLVGIPEMGTPEKKGKPALLKFKALLRPLQIGGYVRIKSRAYEGDVLIKTVGYDGDTAGGNWFVNVEGVLKQ